MRPNQQFNKKKEGTGDLVCSIYFKDHNQIVLCITGELQFHTTGQFMFSRERRNDDVTAWANMANRPSTHDK